MRTILIACVFAGSLVAQTFSLQSTDGLKPNGVKVEAVTFKGKQAVRVTQQGSTPGDQATEDTIAIVGGTNVQDGVIELEISGDVGPGATAQARGFVGVAFRAAPDLKHFECFYLRPTNGRADDQVRRNHSAQYVSVPGFPWPHLRKEFPEKYESYVDLVPGEWTKVKIEVRGEKARLFVHGAEQATLIVNDLKQGATAGAVGLWIGPGTVGHFRDLRITK